MGEVTIGKLALAIMRRAMAPAPNPLIAPPAAPGHRVPGLEADEAARLAGQVTLKQLRAFAAVAGDGSFTGAAQRLFVSQSAVSALVRGLESALGLRLLDRSTRRLALTPVGADLLPAVQRLLDDLLRLAGDAREVAQRRRGRVRLGTTPLLGASLLPPMLASYAQRYPGVDLRLHDAPADELLARLRAGELDLLLATLDPVDADLVATPVLSDVMHLACARSHPLAGRRHLAWAALAYEPLLLMRSGSGLRSLVDRCLAEAGVRPRVAQEVTQVSSALALAAAGLGLAIVPAHALRVAGLPALASMPLTLPTVRRQVLLVHLASRSLSPAAAAMRAHLADQFERPAGSRLPAAPRRPDGEPGAA